MVGGGNSAAQEALYLNNLGCNVKLVHRRDELRCEHHLQNALKENAGKKKVSFNGKDYPHNYITHEMIEQGGVLVFGITN